MKNSQSQTIVSQELRYRYPTMLFFLITVAIEVFLLASTLFKGNSNISILSMLLCSLGGAFVVLNLFYFKEEGWGFGSIFVSLMSLLFVSMGSLGWTQFSTISVAIVVLSLVAFVPFLIISIEMLITAFSAKSIVNCPAVIIILGTKTINGKPAKELSSRLNKALKLYSINSDLVFLVSGGCVSENEYSEASVMKTYLISRGVPVDNIVLETKARNTNENIAYTAEILKKQNNNLPIYILSNYYHLFRIKRVCKWNHINCSLIGSFARSPFLLQIWGREMFNVLLVDKENHKR